MSNDNAVSLMVLAVLGTGYLLPSIVVTFRGCRRAWVYWLLKITTGWSVLMWAYLMFRAIFRVSVHVSELSFRRPTDGRLQYLTGRARRAHHDLAVVQSATVATAMVFSQQQHSPPSTFDDGQAVVQHAQPETAVSMTAHHQSVMERRSRGHCVHGACPAALRSDADCDGAD